MATFERKKVWHSYLKNKSPLVIRFTSDPQDSKYDDGKIIFFEVQGDNTEGYYLVPENDEIIDTVKATAKRQWIKVTAEGKDDTASLQIEASSGGGNAPSSNRSSTSGNGNSSNSSGNERFGPGTIVDQFREAAETARSAFPEAFEDGDFSEDARYIISSLFIQWGKTGRFVPLYEGQMGESYYSNKEALAGAAEPVDENVIGMIEEYLKSMNWKGESHDEKDLAAVKKALKKAVAGGNMTAEDGKRSMSWLVDEYKHQDREPEPVEEEEEEDVPLPF